MVADGASHFALKAQIGRPPYLEVRRDARALAHEIAERNVDMRDAMDDERDPWGPEPDTTP